MEMGGGSSRRNERAANRGMEIGGGSNSTNESAAKKPMEMGGGSSSRNEDTMEHNPAARRKPNHRHTPHQIQQMELFFEKNPYPDKKQRIKLSEDLGLDQLQVKFWFQNRHLQIKTCKERDDNARLKKENSDLKSENKNLEYALNNLTCLGCSIDGSLEMKQLSQEHMTIRQEYERVWTTASRIVGPSLEHMLNRSQPTPMSNNLFRLSGKFDAHIMDEEKSLAMQLALSSLEELRKMCVEAEPLWIRGGDGKQVFNIEEYDRIFPGERSGLSKASRESALIQMNGITLVQTFLDADKWMELFPSIILKAKTLEIIEATQGNVTGFLHLMQAEMQISSLKEFQFMRYCRQDADGTWAIVDSPLDGLKDSGYASPSPRKPSGCIIQNMENGYSRVTWVEHVVEVENDHILAEKWLAALKRQCERLARQKAEDIFNYEVIPSPDAKTSLMDVAKRMVRAFFVGLSSCNGGSWIPLLDCSAEDSLKVSTWSATEPRHPIGLILGAVITTWLPYCHRQVFHLLRDERRGDQMEVPYDGKGFQKAAHIATANGSDHPGNCISLHSTDGANSSSQSMDFILQESYTDESESVVVYTKLDSIDVEEVVMYGTDPSIIPILPCGFVMVPVNQSQSTTAQGSTTRNTGCLLTVGLQLLASSDPYATLNRSSVTAMEDHLRNIIHQINRAFSGASTSGCHNSNGLIGGRSSN